MDYFNISDLLLKAAVQKFVYPKFCSLRLPSARPEKPVPVPETPEHSRTGNPESVVSLEPPVSTPSHIRPQTPVRLSEPVRARHSSQVLGRTEDFQSAQSASHHTTPNLQSASEILPDAKG